MTLALEPLVSVVIPTFNRRDLLPQAVDSVLGQTHRNLELIIVDDGSTDGTEAYLRTLDDPRIRVITRPHVGIYPKVRNAGIAESRGDYVALLDSDDVWAPDKLARQLDALSRQSGAGWCHGSFSTMDVTGNVIPFRAGGWEPLHGDISDAVLEREAAMHVSTLLVARALGERLAWFDMTLDLGDDLDFVIRLAEASPAAAVSAPVIAYSRFHTGATSSRYRTTSHHWIARVFDRAAARATTPRRRRLARRARSHRISWIANNHAAHGLRREAKDALRLAGARGARSIRWWKAVIRLALPIPTDGPQSMDAQPNLRLDHDRYPDISNR